MKVVTYNIQYSLGRDGRCDLARIADAVREADVIALQEVERFWARSGMEDQPAALAALLPEHHYVYGPALDLDASERGEGGRVLHRRRQFGNMLLSRSPILSSRNHLLPYVGTSTHSNQQCAMLEGVLEVGGRALRVCSLHLAHLSVRERLAQVEQLLERHRRAWLEGGVWEEGPDSDDADEEPPGPPPPMPFEALYLGDFNFEPGGPEYAALVGPWDPDYGRVGYRDLLVDAWVAAGHAEREGVTFPPNPLYPASEAGWRLDYAFLSPTLRPALKRAWIDEEAEGSDHQPFWLELEI